MNPVQRPMARRSTQRGTRGTIALILLGFGLGGASFGCISATSLTDRPCPCASGFACCETSNTCLPSPLPASCSVVLGGSNGGGAGGSVFDSPAGGSSSLGAATGGAGSTSGGAAGTGLAPATGGTSPVVVGTGGSGSAGGSGSVGGTGGNAGGGSSALGGSSSTAGSGEAGAGGAGGAYWDALAASPLGPRRYHNAVWAGNEQGVGRLMIWGGEHQVDSTLLEMHDGALYDPRANSWSSVSQQGAPLGHATSAAVWTGKRVLVFGGENAASSDPWAAYDPVNNVWEPLPTCPFDDPYITRPFFAWTGQYFLILSEGFGIRYDVGARQWSRISSTGAPFASGGSAVWTGSEWLLWGGLTANSGPATGGAAYDPTTDQWTPLPDAGAPSQRQNHVAVWTGKYMVIWGGAPVTDAPVYSDVAYAYDPATQTWSQYMVDSPANFGSGFPVVTTSQAILMWTGYATPGLPAPYGHALDWQSWKFSMMPIENQPAPRIYHSATWTGREMIIWGGQGNVNDDLADGGRYFP